MIVVCTYRNLVVGKAVVHKVHHVLKLRIDLFKVYRKEITEI